MNEYIHSGEDGILLKSAPSRKKLFVIQSGKEGYTACFPAYALCAHRKLFHHPLDEFVDLGDLKRVGLMKIGSNARQQYYLKMKVKIDKVRLPLYMEYVFFFVSFWDFETAWYKKDFSY